MKKTTGHLTEKNGKWYAVLNLYDTEGKRKEKWQNLELEARRGTKNDAMVRLNEILTRLNRNIIYIDSMLSPAELERKRKSNQLIDEYIVEWLEEHRANIEISTYNSYYTMIHGRVLPHFKKLNMALSEITGEEINDFYSSLAKGGLSGTTRQRYHAILHLIFKNAVKRRIIPVNPCEQVDRTRTHQYIGSYYNVYEIRRLLDCLDGDLMRIPVILTSFYGLRRSEVLGLKWDSIDWKENKIIIKHKILEDKLNKNKIIGLNIMKNKSSYRTLPLIDAVKDILLKEKESQEQMQKLLKKSYNHEYLEYVCVDQLGNIIKPNYVSSHFQIILKENNLKRIRFHDLRHSCASMLLANKVPMKMIQEWLGHSDMGTTANIYSHLDYTSKKESADVIGKALTN